MNRKLSFLLVAIVFFLHVNAQIITTIAGNGISGYSGDGGPAITAELYGPTGITIDNVGNVYFTDVGNNRVRKINTAGVISTIAGTGSGYSGDGGAATLAELNTPVGVAIDRSGNVYITDEMNNRVRKIEVSGIITTIAGNGYALSAGDGGLATAANVSHPSGITVDNIGNIYFCEGWRVRKIDTSGIINTIAGKSFPGYSGDNGQATAASLYYPFGIALDYLGDLYITDLDNNNVRKVAPSGIITTIAGTGMGYSGDCNAATAALLRAPYDVAADNTGNVYISDLQNFCLRKVDTSGIITTIAGMDSAGFAGDGGNASLALFGAPAGLVMDALGNLYITDGSNNDIRRISNVALLTGDCNTTFAESIIQTATMLTVYPNPSTGTFTLNISSSINEQAQISITNLLGQKVKELNASTNKVTDVALNAPPGIYFLTATTAQGKWNEQVVIAP